MYQPKRQSVKDREADEAAEINAVVLVVALIIFHAAGLIIFSLITGA